VYSGIENIEITVEWRDHDPDSDTNYNRDAKVYVGDVLAGTVVEYHRHQSNTGFEYYVCSASGWGKWHGPYGYPQQAVAHLLANTSPDFMVQVFTRAGLKAKVGG
jgi:hypothetical protein